MILGFTGNPKPIFDWLYSKAITLAKWGHSILLFLGTALFSLSFKFFPRLDQISVEEFASKICSGKAIEEQNDCINSINWVDVVIHGDSKLFVWIAIVGFIFLVWGAIGNLLDKQELSKRAEKLPALRDKVNDAERNIEELRSNLEEKNKELARSYVEYLNNKLGLSTEDRVSVYFKHDEHFYLLTRYSSNPRYNEVNRTKFPYNHGVISKAWENGEYCEADCPKYEDEPDNYCSHMDEHYDYGEDKVDSLTMKSHRFYGIGIAKQGKTIGTLLVESVNCERITEELKTRTQEFKGVFETHLVQTLETSRAEG